MHAQNPLIQIVIVCVALIALCTSCAPTYDDIADQMLVETQKQADNGLARLESLASTIETLKENTNPNPADKKALVEAEQQDSYVSNADFYYRLDSSIDALDTRMTAISDLSTPSLRSALSQLKSNVDVLRTAHQTQNTLSLEATRDSKTLLDEQFKALTVYELTIKDGSKPK